jgi:radical SAM protein with 4Fe4S-binding SPASM domain
VLQLAEVGIQEVTLIGGEAYLRQDWPVIVTALRSSGINCSITTGGYGLSQGTARRMHEAGVQQVSVSIDGACAATHDMQRGRPGSYAAAYDALANLRAAGVPVTCNTQINRLSAPELSSIYQQIRDAGCRAWQWQMTVPMGRAAHHPDMLLQPYDLLELFPRLANLAETAANDGLLIFPGNNVGYYGPYERLLRRNSGSFWNGCHAGLTGLGIESDGTIKGCPSLPTSAYTGGNIRERKLRDTIDSAPELAINRNGGTLEGESALWGFCKTCEYASLCRGGCHWTAHVFFDRRGNNPYCHHRALTMKNRGVRERLVQLHPGPGLPFDNGKFAIIEEPLTN